MAGPSNALPKPAIGTTKVTSLLTWFFTETVTVWPFRTASGLQSLTVRGIATSGFGGRSFSLGIADAVTILAKDAASADAVATLIANAVDLPDHPAIRRAPARDFDPQSDLGERLVTREVGALTDGEIAAALDAGVQEAERLRDGNHLFAAALNLRGQVRTIGALESRSNLPQVSHV